MPQAAAAFLISAIATPLVGATVAGWLALGGTLLISSAQARREAKKANEAMRNAYEASLQDRTTVVRSPLMPRNVVMGRDRTSGPLACWFNWGSIKQYHTFAVVLAGHECDAVEQYLFNEEPVAIDGNGWVTTEKYIRRYIRVQNDRLNFDGAGVATTTLAPLMSAEEGGLGNVLFNSLRALIPNAGIDPVNGGPIDAWVRATSISGNTITIPEAAGLTNVAVNYNTEILEPLFRIWTYLGAPGQQASSVLMAAAAAAGAPDEWDSNRRGASVCYCVVQMEADFDILGQVGVPNISAITRGVKARDLRFPDDPPTWTQNPARLVNWFLVDSIYSPKTLQSEVGDDELIASTNVCVEQIAFSSTETLDRYVANGQISSATIPLGNLRKILDAMDGDAVWVSGAWQIVAGAYRAPTVTLNPSALSESDITIAPYTPKDKLFNLVTGSYVSAENNYARTSYAAVRVQEYVDEDGEELPATVDFDLVDDTRRCQMIAWQRLTRARQQLTVQFGTNLRGYDLWPTETCNLAWPEFFGPSPKVVALQRREFDNGRLLYVGQETGPEVWDWDYTKAQQAVDIPNTSLPNPFDLPAPQVMTLASGDAELEVAQDGTITSRIRVRLASTTNPYVLNAGFLEKRYAVAGTEDWISAPAGPGAETDFWISPVLDGVSYSLQFRYRNQSGRVSSWSLAALHTVIGKREPPPAVTGVSLSTTKVFFDELTKLQIKDLAGYIIRAIPGSSPQWSLGTTLQEGIVTESPWEILQALYGIQTVMVAAIDTTGNVGPIGPSSYSTQNFGSPDTSSAIQQFDFGANGWPGVITSGSIEDGVIEADLNPDADFWSIGADFWVRDNAVDFWGGADYLPLTYISSFVPDYGGGLILLELQTSGSRVTIEYRVDGATVGDFWDGNAGAGGVADFWSGTGFWGENLWQPWLGSATSQQGAGIQWRVSIDGGPQQGVISSMVASLVLQLVQQVFAAMTISSGGTRLNPAGGIPARDWISVTSVTANPIDDGSGAVGMRIKDLNPDLGPLIELVNSSGTAVTGTAPPVVYGFANINNS